MNACSCQALKSRAIKAKGSFSSLGSDAETAEAFVRLLGTGGTSGRQGHRCLRNFSRQAIAVGRLEPPCLRDSVSVLTRSETGYCLPGLFFREAEGIFLPVEV